uniref:Putative dynein assembly factor 3 axonemal n=1 Tax=Lutzomyia longipalpis TaxID=7200 RepID=A0A1B0CQD4_LUTLO
MFWGWSESLNLLEKWRDHFKADILPGDFNILLFGPGDPRHILTLLAKSYNLPEGISVNFFQVDSCMEHVARNLLLLTVALESGQEMSVRGKTHLFMDIFGNSHLRPASANYLKGRTKFLTKVATDGDFEQESMPMVSLGELKYRERDKLEATFSFWANEGVPFEIKSIWDRRLRENLKTRYDYRNGVFDWDLQMQLRDRGAGQICPQEYTHWRECGIGFVFPEFEQVIPNKTLGINSGNQWAFLGDMTVGPFISFGLNCPDERMLKSQHGVNEYRATDVTERNLMEIFHEILERKPYSPTSEDYHRFGGASLKMGSILPSSGLDSGSLPKSCENFPPLLKFPNFSLTFVSPEDLERFLGQERMQEKFSVIFVGQNFFPVFREEFLSTLHPKGLILFETRRFTTLRKDTVNEFSSQIRDFCSRNSLKSLNPPLNQHFSILSYKKKE